MTKDEKIKEILGVLDLPEIDQSRWCFEHIPSCRYGFESLADLAFRLRDEIGISVQVMVLVRDMAIGPLSNPKVQNPELSLPLFDWWITKSQPIHWVCAALIAKILSEDK